MSNNVKNLIYIYREDIARANGTPLRALNILKNLAKKNKILLFCEGFEKTDIKSNNIEYVNIKKLNSFQICNLYKEKILKFSPEIIYSQSVYASFLGSLMKYKFKIKHVIDIHSFIRDDFIYVDNKSRFNKKVIFLHTLELISFWYADGLTVVSSLLKRRFPFKKTILIHGGVNEKIYNNKKSKVVESCKKKHNFEIVITYAGNSKDYQGIKYLFEAIHHLKEESKMLFIFAGNFDDKHKIKNFNLIKEQPNVKFLGQLPSSQIPEIMNSSDILVVPRTTDKINYLAFPSKLTEYLFSKKAVIATKVGDIPKLIRNNKTGILIKPNSGKSISDAILKLKSKTLRNKLAKNAYEFVSKKYKWQQITEKIDRFLNKIIRE